MLPTKQIGSDKLSKYFLYIGLLLILASVSSFTFLQTNFSKKSPSDTAKNTQESSSSAQAEIVPITAAANATLSAEVAKKSEKVQLLTTSLLQTAKENNLIKQSTSSNTKVKGEETSIAKDQAISKLNTIATERKGEMLALLEKSPQAFINNAMLTHIRNSLPEQVQPLLEKELEMKGTLTVYHETKADNQPGKFFYSVDDSKTLKSSPNKKTLYLTKPDPKLKSGSTIQVKGIGIDDQLAVSTQTAANLNVINTKPQSATVEHNLAVVQVKFPNTRSTPFSADELKSTLFTDNQSVSKHLQESSYNLMSIKGEVFPSSGAFSLPTDSCNITEILDSTWDAIQGSVPITSFTDLMIVLPKQRTCYFIGLATVGKHGDMGVSFINGLNEPKVLAHEFGHNLGLEHADTLYCPNKSVDNYNDCGINDSGDFYDPMSYYRTSKPNLLVGYNAPHRANLGWIPNNRIKEISTKGQFSEKIYTLEDSSAPGNQIVKIKKTDTTSNYNDYYYLSYRQPKGFDTNLPQNMQYGLSIHISDGTSSWLVDANPQTSTYEDSALMEMRTFNDATNNIKVIHQPLPISGNYDAAHPWASVTIIIGEAVCVENKPTFTISPSVQSGSAGQTLNYLLNVTNNDTPNCPPSTFNFTGGFESVDWIKDYKPATLTLNPNSSGTSTLSLTSPTYKQFGSNIARVGIEAGNLVHSVGDYLSYVVFVPSAAIESVSPTSASPNIDVTITGTNFGTVSGAVFFSYGGPKTPIGIRAEKIAYWDDKKIIAKVPKPFLDESPKGKIRVIPKTTGSIVSANDFEITDTPVISEWSPKSGTSGTEIKVTGKGFGLVDKAVILVGDIPAQVLNWGDTEIKAKIPDNVKTGKILIKAVYGKTTRSNEDFVVLSSPKITSLSPREGAVGTNVTITGDNFGGAKGKVYFSETEANVGTWSDTSITATVPTYAASGKVKITTSDNRVGESADSFTVTSGGDSGTGSSISYRITGAVAIKDTDSAGANRFSAVSCPSKPYRIDTSMTVTHPTLGSANWDCSDPNFYFGPSKGANATIKSGLHTFSITPPSGYKCSWYATYEDRTNESYKDCKVNVDLSKNNGSVFLWFFLVADSSSGTNPTPNPSPSTSPSSPTISSLSSSSAPVGTKISFNGANFGSSKGSVSFNGTNATEVDWFSSGVLVDAKVPTGATTGKVTITTSDNRTVTTSSDFTVTPTTFLINYKISGAVAIQNTDSAGPNRFTQSTCPGTTFKTDSSMNVQSSSLGLAVWDCGDPKFSYGLNYRVMTSGSQNFTLTPPSGYSCAGYAVSETRNSDSFSNCTITIDISQSYSSVFLWFYVKPNTLGVTTSSNNELSINSTNLGEGRWLNTYSAELYLKSNIEITNNISLEGLPLMIQSTCFKTSNTTAKCSLSGTPLSTGSFMLDAKVTDYSGKDHYAQTPLVVR